MTTVIDFFSRMATQLADPVVLAGALATAVAFAATLRADAAARRRRQVRGL